VVMGQMLISASERSWNDPWAQGGRARVAKSKNGAATYSDAT
jgi:hypothetical protein